MPVPSVVKFTKNGVEYTSSVDRANYYIYELTRAALKDVGKYICRHCRLQNGGMVRRISGARDPEDPKSRGSS